MNNKNPIIHTDIEPGVISTQMIKDALREQGPKGEAGRLMEEESQDIQKTPSKHLRLEFLSKFTSCMTCTHDFFFIVIF